VSEDRLLSARFEPTTAREASTVEVEPPRGADCRSSIEAARLLRGLGVDAVNVTDNPMARLRMSSVAVAGLIQRETGLDAIVQFTTRDRNVLGIQSDLLGASALGLKALLCLGGDPLKIGDYPDGHQVSEVDTLGLLRIAKILNAGADLVGNPIGAPTSFAIGCAANPAARDLEVEFSKLRAKIEAGATFAQTQPVFDPAALLRLIEELRVTVLPGAPAIYQALLESAAAEIAAAARIPASVLQFCSRATEVPVSRAMRESDSRRSP